MPYVASQIRRKNNALFALLDQLDVKLSQYLVADDASRDAIPDYVRMTGCECRVLDSAEAGGGEAIYQLESDLITWTVKVLTDYIPVSEKGAASGVAQLDSDGFILSTQLRNLFINDAYVVADEAAMLALTTTRGNVVMLTDAPDAGEVWLKLNDDDPATIADFADLTSVVGVSSVKVGENGVASTGAVAFTLSTLLAATSNFTSFNSQIASAPSVAGNTSAISTLQSDITAINQAISDLQDAIAALGTGITVHNQTLEYAINRFVWASGRVYKSISAVPVDILITNATYWDVFGGYPEDVLTDGDVEATLTGTVGKLPDSNAVKTYVDDLLPGVGVPGGALGSIQTNLDDQVFDGFGNWNGQRMQIDFEDGVVDVKEMHSLKRTSSVAVSWGEVGTDAIPVGVYGHTCLDFDNKIWIIGGRTSTGLSRKVFWSDDDGATWTEAGTDSLPVATEHHSSVVFDLKMWVIGGNTGSGATRKVYWSTDGITWTEAGTDALPEARSRLSVVVFDDGGGDAMFLIGNSNIANALKVRKSLDGITWTEVGTDVFPIPIGFPNALVFDNKIWTIGGYNNSGGTLILKVYSSPTGEVWSESGTDVLPVTRYLSTTIVYDNKIWAIGGFQSLAVDSIYWSSDGTTWNEYGTPLPIGLASAKSLIVNGQIYIFGGGTGNLTTYSRKVYAFSGTSLTGMGVNDSVYLQNDIAVLREALKRITRWSSSDNSEYAIQVLLNGVLTEVLSLVGDHMKLNGFAQLQEIADPAGVPDAGFGRLWLSSDTSKLRFQDDSGNKFNIDMTAV